MDKRVKINPLALALGMMVVAFLCFPSRAYSIDGSSQTSYDGHLCAVSGAARPVCGSCHIPHGSKGKRILVYRNARTSANQLSIKEFCAGCHYRPNPEFPAINSGILMGAAQWNGGKNKEMNNINGNVFLGGSANHVMGTDAACRLHTQAAEVPDAFPLDEKEGFSCVTCHDPHFQPQGKVDGHVDYLRVKDNMGSAGQTHNRNSFCRQCHPKDGNKARIHSGESHDPQCEACHRPHDGYPIPDDPTLERYIFVQEVANPSPFSFPPEPYESPYGSLFSFPPDSPSLRRERVTPSEYDHECSDACYYVSSKCMDCHASDDHPDAPQLSENRGRHPMGGVWADTSCAVCHPSLPSRIRSLLVLDGFHEDGTPLAPKQQVFTCISCHTVHNADPATTAPISLPAAGEGTIEGNPNRLRYASFQDDDTAFCEFCHNSPEHPKSQALLKAKGGRHYKTRHDPKNPIERTFQATAIRPEKKVACGGCMFCHFMHQNDKDDSRDTALISSQRADLRALMRVPARELNWGTQGADNAQRPDPLDRYESLCYGCHGDPSIVGSYGKNGSLLYPAWFFSHRFACQPSSVNTISNTSGPAGFPLGDGVPGPGPSWADARDDYGTVADQIYCGTCHDVHINTKSPYLYRLIADDTASPYEPDGFCEQCHCLAASTDPLSQGGSHPLGYEAVPSPPVTGNEFPSVFAGGGSGSNRGITAGGNTTQDGIVCLTCHNVHAASTSWNGAVPGDAQVPPGKMGKHGQLLVMDNFSSGSTGSNLCLACHEQYGDQPALMTTYYLDNDGDGYGDISQSRQLSTPEGKYTALEPGDLDDTNPLIYPWATPLPGAPPVPYAHQCTGDTNQDGQVTPADALLIFQCSLGFGGCPSECADVTKDGQISPADALCIFRRFLGIPGCLDQ